MNKLTITFTFLIFLLVIFQPICSAASAADVRILISDANEMIANIDSQISSLQGYAGGISPCPSSDGTSDPCSSARATALSVLSNLAAKMDTAKTQLGTASSDLDNGAPLPNVMNEIGTSLSTVNSGINYAITEAGTIPASCPDENGNDICPGATDAARSSLASISRSYQTVKAEYDKLAGTATQLTPQQQEDQQKNTKLLSASTQLRQAEQLRQTIKNLEQSGASEDTLKSSRAELKDMEDNLTKTYEDILNNSRYYNDFWTNWDYATLKKDQGDRYYAIHFYALALSSTNVDEKSKTDFMNKLRKDSQSELGLSAPPSSDSSVMQSIGKDLHYMYDKSVWTKSVVFHDFHCAVVSAMAKTGQLVSDFQKFRDTFSGKNTVVQPNQ
jgi:hypothetical protein